MSFSLTLGLGKLFYVGLLCINAVAVLNEDRFLAQSKFPVFNSQLVGLASSTYHPDSFRHKLVHIIASVRTLLRGISIFAGIC